MPASSRAGINHLARAFGANLAADATKDADYFVVGGVEFLAVPHQILRDVHRDDAGASEADQTLRSASANIDHRPGNIFSSRKPAPPKPCEKRRDGGRVHFARAAVSVMHVADVPVADMQMEMQPADERQNTEADADGKTNQIKITPEKKGKSFGRVPPSSLSGRPRLSRIAHQQQSTSANPYVWRCAAVHGSTPASRRESIRAVDQPEIEFVFQSACVRHQLLMKTFGVVHGYRECTLKNFASNMRLACVKVPGRAPLFDLRKVGLADGLAQLFPDEADHFLLRHFAVEAAECAFHLAQDP